MRNQLIRSCVILGISLTAGFLAAPDTSAAPQTASHCTKFVTVREGPSEARKQLCEMYYYGTLIPGCRARQSQSCYEAAAQWLADCYVGKADPPYSHTALAYRADD